MMSVACNEVRSAAVDTDFNANRMSELFSYWIKKPNIKKRYTRPNGVFEQQIAEDGLKSYVWDILELPFIREQNFTDKDYKRMRVAVDGYNKDLTGKYKNIAGLFATPRGYTRLDPTSKEMLNDLEQAKNFERNRMSYVELYLQNIKDMIFSAHVDTGKASKLFKRNKSYVEFRGIRNKILQAKDENLETKAHAEVEGFFNSDNGKLLMNIVN